MRIKFFHTPKPKQFNYKPRFYDPRKEHIEKLKSESDNPELTETTERFKEHMSRLRERGFNARKRQRGNMTLVIMLALMGLLIYFIFR